MILEKIAHSCAVNLFNRTQLDLLNCVNHSYFNDRHTRNIITDISEKYESLRRQWRALNYKFNECGHCKNRLLLLQYAPINKFR